MPNDDYPTCQRTYATLRIDPSEIDPTTITAQLAINPSSWQRRGEVVARGGRPAMIARMSGWFLSSKGQVDSPDSQNHIAWILDQLVAKRDVIQSLQADGCVMDVSCYWLSRYGHGGPTVSPSLMRRLGELNIELWFDFYGPFDGA